MRKHEFINKKIQDLTEVKMSPSSLDKWIKSPEAEGMLMGIEFEMGVPNVGGVDSDPEWEYDYDRDTRASDINDIINFFREGDFSNMSSREADRLRSEMQEQFWEWQNEQISENLDQDELRERIRDRLEEDLDIDDYTEQAAEELGLEWEDNEENAQKVSKLAEKLMSRALDELMDGGREFETAYDEIRQEMEDELRDDSNYDEESWLNDIGIRYMSEAEREWNLDWPHMRDVDEGGGGEDLETVAEDFSQALGGVKVNTSSSYHGARRDGVSWIVEPDTSIETYERDHGGLEFVSPPMPLADGLEAIKKVYAWAKKRGCYTNESTGLHVNISVPNLTLEGLDYVKLALFLGDKYVLEQFGRQANSYTRSAMEVVKRAAKNPEVASTVLGRMKSQLNTAAGRLIHNGITEKYTSINTKDKYVEFRGPGGDYLDKNPDELINTALRLAMSLRIATDETAYKQEYAKKLYKLLDETNPSGDGKNTIELFAKYATGEVDKQTLLSQLRYTHRDRIAKKLPVGTWQIYNVNFKDNPNYTLEVAARSPEEAISAAQDKELTWSRYSASNFVATSTGKIVDQRDDNEVWKIARKDNPDAYVYIRAATKEEAIEKALSRYRNVTVDQVTIEPVTNQTTAPTAEPPVSSGSTLPVPWQEFLSNLTDLSSEYIQRMYHAMRGGAYNHNTNVEQRSELMMALRQELTRRNQSQAQEFSPSDMLGMPQVTESILDLRKLAGLDKSL